MKTTPHRKKPIRVGFVRIAELQPGKWEARFQNPANGKDVKRVLPVSTEAEAREMAMEFNKAVLSDRGMLPGAKAKGGGGPGVADALKEAIRATGAGTLSLERSVKGANAFQAYLRENYPTVATWADVRPSMITAWVQSMQKAGRAFDTIRLSLVPVRQASAYWAAEYPERYRDIVKAAKVKLKRPPLQKQARVLSAEELKTLLAWLKINRPALWPLAVLSGMAGFRMLEAAYLRTCDIDWAAGTATVTETDRHTPKNRTSWRTLPLHPEALQAIREHLCTQRVREASAEGPAFLHSRGKAWAMNGLLAAWQKALRKAREEKELAFLQDFQPHHLRATFATLSRKAKADVRALQVYLGHTPSDMLGCHYEVINLEDLRREVVESFGRIWTQETEEIWKETGSSESKAL